MSAARRRGLIRPIMAQIGCFVTRAAARANDTSGVA